MSTWLMLRYTAIVLAIHCSHMISSAQHVTTIGSPSQCLAAHELTGNVLVKFCSHPPI